MTLHYGETPGDNIYSITPGGTRIYYDRTFLLSRRESPLTRSPPLNLPYIPEGFIYLNHLPVIIDDATETWPAMKELTINKLFQLFIEDPVLAENDLCYFETNIRNYNQVGGADRLFNDYINGNRRSFIVQWNNCKRETLKVIRSYYNKPYFLPPSVAQTLMGNWFLVSAGFHKGIDYLHKIPLNYDWVWLAQIQGSSLIELRPKYPCEKMCSILKSVTLNKGDLSNNCFLFLKGPYWTR
ncbi:unnamed protein product [Rotaria sp. Silwood2]|nr:unnamed protein product [Rotaria sp. Silwood2]